MQKNQRSRAGVAIRTAGKMIRLGMKFSEKTGKLLTDARYYLESLPVKRGGRTND